MTAILPDVEDAVIRYLLTTEVADLVEDRIYADTPEGVVWPYLTVQKITEQDKHHWLAGTTLQLGGWASKANPGTPRATARDICETAVAMLHDAIDFYDGEIVLGRGEVVEGPRSIPDPVTDNPRFLADVRIMYHPSPSSS